MIEIPQRLIDAGARFIKLGNHSKIPVEAGYHKDKNYDGDDERIQEHIRHHGNYGVLPRNDVCFIDIDDFEIFQESGIVLPDSFLVKRGDAHRGHYYFLCHDAPEDKRDKFLLTFGDVRLGGANWFVVGPSCRHPSGDLYSIHRDYPLATLDYAFIADIIKRFGTGQAPKQATQRPRSVHHGQSLSEKLGLSMEMFMPDNAVQKNHGHQGANPWHGSDGGANYCVDLHKGMWHCFRCKSGGGPLEAYAVSRGIISCEDAGPGCLEGKWGEIYKAREADGYTTPDVLQGREDLKNLLKEMGVL